MAYKFNPLSSNFDYYDDSIEIISEADSDEYLVQALKINASGEVILTYNDTPGHAVDPIASNPTTGEYKVREIRRDNSGQIILVYDDNPQ